jgi:hypothetical protein
MSHGGPRLENEPGRVKTGGTQGNQGQMA